MKPSTNTTKTLVRFPIVFGSVLGLLAIGFAYRDTFLGDIESQRENLLGKQDVEGAKLYREKVNQMRKDRQ